MSSSAAAEGRLARRRADLLAVERGLAPTRERARALILAGELLCEGARVSKPGALLPAGARLELRPRRRRFVGRGGDKLDGALTALGVDPRGALAWDIGASVGGFTDCLLQRGAARVVAVDVGRGQLDVALRGDARLVVREGLNARYLRPGELPGPPRLVLVDVSFISLEKVMPALAAAAPQARIIALVKPQFEVGRGRVGRGGIVIDPALQEEVLRRLCGQSAAWGLRVAAVVESPLRGAEGNREFFVHWAPAKEAIPEVDVGRLVHEAVHGGQQTA